MILNYLEFQIKIGTEDLRYSLENLYSIIYSKLYDLERYVNGIVMTNVSYE